MCIGENAADTLRHAEQSFLQAAARVRLPGYGAEVRTNADDIAWVVLTPAPDDGMPRFTICRIDPCVLVMVEDRAQRRRFTSLATVEDAIAFACRTVQESALAVRNVHPAPEIAQ